jgi:HB1, ASXL, restriction endonuclease HTH domain
MTYREAALAILRTARRPMTTREITAAALKKGLITTQGMTPEATMSAALYRYVRDVKGALIRREFTPGPTRAARESVRWALMSRV